MSFGTKIRQIRLQKELSQIEVSKRLGHGSQSYISDVESGKFIPTEEKLDTLARALELTRQEMDDLLLEERLEQLGLDDPAFTMMFKEVPRMTKDEKQSLIRAYESVIRARGSKRAHEKGSATSGEGLPDLR
jgi:transcriptional regulator with XRE-family HTH domain